MIGFLDPGDLLVINRTQVFPARIFGRKLTSGGKVEILLIRKIADTSWEALIGGQGIKEGLVISIENGPQVEIKAKGQDRTQIISFEKPIEPFLSRVGNTPLPPYIHTKLEDSNRYQTIYANNTGSAAAPTAGLHFTHRLMGELDKYGIRFADIVLHIGLDTFAPVKEDEPGKHRIHREWCTLSKHAADLINLTKDSGKKVIAVGTTCVRTLETATRDAPLNQFVKPFEGYTDLFILPGYSFHVVDALITNFHLPRSTLLMLVSAFAGRESILTTYQLAIQERYRFYSFGDAMLIL